MQRLKQHWKALVVSGVVVVIVLAVGIPYVYIHAFNGKQEKALSVNDVPSASSSATGNASPVSAIGTWTVSDGSQAGYRVKETLAGQQTTAVGRTSKVSGSLTVAGTSVSKAAFTVQMATVTSDKSQRDGQFAGRIMDTAKYPTGTFTLTQPIDLGSIPAIGKTITAKATGKLMLHGVSRTETFSVQAKRSAASLAISGSIPITYADYQIDNPSFGNFVSVGDTGTVEFLLVTTRS